MWYCTGCGYPLGQIANHNLFLNRNAFEIAITENGLVLCYCNRCQMVNELEDAYYNYYGEDTPVIFSEIKGTTIWQTFSIFDEETGMIDEDALIDYDEDLD